MDHSPDLVRVAGVCEGSEQLIGFDVAALDVAALDATGGTVPANVDAFAAVQPADEVDARRLAITRDTIATGMLPFPPLERFPAVEDAGWQAINDALRGEVEPATVPSRIQAATLSVLA